MSKISLAPDASGTGIFTIASPNSNTNRTLTLPDDTGTLALTSAALTGTTDSGTPFETALGSGAGAVNTGVNNVFVGFEAGNDNTTGTNNTALGYQALDVNTTGTSNTAVGSAALGANTTGANNTAVGYGALDANTTGSNSTAVGIDALGANTTGSACTAIGRLALRDNTTGGNNTALGNSAVRDNTTGSGNTGIGESALQSNTTGANNTAVGFQALDANTTGASNTAFGRGALGGNTTGTRNIGVGLSAGAGMLTATDSICIGHDTQLSGTADVAEIVIGCSGAGSTITGKGNSTGFINPASGGMYQGNNSSSWSTVSDQRLKKNIVDNTEGLEIISQLRVCNFEYRLPEEVDPELKPSDAVGKTGVQLGVIAQELQQVCPDCVKEESTGVLSVDSDNVFWHMVSAIKELSAQVSALQAEVNSLKGQ